MLYFLAVISAADAPDNRTPAFFQLFFHFLSFYSFVGLIGSFHND
tara:strand:+ start:1425 stop:1559 length:135 start_codon:yes stop_codon:yes gene_type:complete